MYLFSCYEQPAVRQSSRSDAKNYKEESGSEVEDDDDDEVFDY